MMSLMHPIPDESTAGLLYLHPQLHPRLKEKFDGFVKQQASSGTSP